MDGRQETGSRTKLESAPGSRPFESREPQQLPTQGKVTGGEEAEINQSYGAPEMKPSVTGEYDQGLDAFVGGSWAQSSMDVLTAELQRVD